MEIRECSSPAEVKTMNTKQLRDAFLVDGLMQAGKIKMVYTHHDRVIVGGAVPVDGDLKLQGAAA